MLMNDISHLAQRDSSEAIAAQVAYLQRLPHLAVLLDALPVIVVILNAHRQIIFANRNAREIFAGERHVSPYGLRPGEILDCQNVPKGCSGCGTSEECTVCGAAKAIGIAEQHCASVQECHIVQLRSGKALDYRVSATPIELDGENLTVLTLTDISAELWSHQLERIFFHDLLNSAGSLREYGRLLPLVGPEEAPAITNAISRLAGTVVDEIEAQRDLQLAERLELASQIEPCSTLAALHNIVSLYANHPCAAGKSLVIDPKAVDCTIFVDRRILNRILSNMLKNALEATPLDALNQPVTIGVTAGGGQLDFWVHNHQFMPRDIQLQVFIRTFSTKGKGRGLGTYSIKLLGTRILRGKVWFTTAPNTGTTFHIALPQS